VLQETTITQRAVFKYSEITDEKQSAHINSRRGLGNHLSTKSVIQGQPIFSRINSVRLSKIPWSDGGRLSSHKNSAGAFEKYSCELD
jgi:hypothetical protein